MPKIDGTPWPRRGGAHPAPTRDRCLSPGQMGRARARSTAPAARRRATASCPSTAPGKHPVCRCAAGLTGRAQDETGKR
eukprot:scaffold3416_cov133-Isochrysis_galbana.AAC.1